MPNSDYVDSKDFLKNMTFEQRQQWARDIVNRMMSAWNVDEHKILAEVLGMHPQTPSNWIQKKAVPWTVIYTCHKETGRSLDWLFDGEEPRTEITAAKVKSFEKSAIELMTYSEKMRLVQQVKADGFDTMAQGLASCFIDAMHPSEQDKPS
jgi:hypothetical protein